MAVTFRRGPVNVRRAVPGAPGVRKRTSIGRQPDPIRNLQASGGAGNVLLTWELPKNQGPGNAVASYGYGETIHVTRNGERIATLPQSATEYTDTEAPFGQLTYRVGFDRTVSLTLREQPGDSGPRTDARTPEAEVVVGSGETVDPDTGGGGGGRPPTPPQPPSGGGPTETISMTARFENCRAVLSCDAVSGATYTWFQGAAQIGQTSGNSFTSDALPAGSYTFSVQAAVSGQATRVAGARATAPGSCGWRPAITNVTITEAATSVRGATVRVTAAEIPRSQYPSAGDYVWQLDGAIAVRTPGPAVTFTNVAVGERRVSLMIAGTSFPAASATFTIAAQSWAVLLYGSAVSGSVVRLTWSVTGGTPASFTIRRSGAADVNVAGSARSVEISGLSGNSATFNIVATSTTGAVANGSVVVALSVDLEPYLEFTIANVDQRGITVIEVTYGARGRDGLRVSLSLLVNGAQSRTRSGVINGGIFEETYGHTINGVTHRFECRITAPGSGESTGETTFHHLRCPTSVTEHSAEVRRDGQNILIWQFFGFRFSTPVWRSIIPSRNWMILDVNGSSHRFEMTTRGSGARVLLSSLQLREGVNVFKVFPRIGGADLSHGASTIRYVWRPSDHS